MKSTDPYTLMPPIGVAIPDSQGITTVEQWLKEAQRQQENSP